MTLQISISLALLASGLAHAQQQERKLEERIMKPDMTLSANEQTRGFGGGKSFSTSNVSTERKFLGTRSFSLKNFFTRSFPQDKNFWTPEFMPAQKAASNSSKPALLQESGKSFETKTVPVSDVNLAKGYGGKRTFETAEAKMEGKSQKALTQEHAKKEMSIDEVRDLLNKNK